LQDKLSAFSRQGKHIARQSKCFGKDSQVLKKQRNCVGKANTLERQVPSQGKTNAF
jgi:hypothetical protein